MVWVDKGIYFFLLAYAAMFSMSVPIANAAIDAAAVLAVVRIIYIRPRRMDLAVKRMLLIMAAYLAVITVTGLTATYDSSLSRPRIWEVCFPMVEAFVATTALAADARRRNTLAAVAAVSITVTSLYVIWQGLHGELKAEGFLGTLNTAEHLGQMLLLLLVLGLEDRALSPAWRRLFVGAAVLSGVALLFNGTRGAWLAVAAALAGYLLAAGSSSWRRRAVAGLAALCLFAGVVMFQNTVRERLFSAFQPHYISVSERFLMWQSAWHMFSDHPLLGVGPGNFQPLYRDKYISPFSQEGPVHSHPHNIFLQTLAESGIAGGVAFFALWGTVFWHYWRRRRRQPGDAWALAVPAAVAAFLLCGMTDDVLFHFMAGAEFAWFLIGLGWREPADPAGD